MEQKKYTQVLVECLPKCEFCEHDAYIDGKTSFGIWANMCKKCHLERGVGIGLGKGQLLIKRR